MKKSVRMFSWLAVLCAGLEFVTCDNTVSLGSNIDLTAPVVNIDSRANMVESAGPAGSYIRDSAKVYIDATDDGVLASVTARLSYWVITDPHNTDRKEFFTVTLPAVYDESVGRYVVNIDTKDAPEIPAADYNGKPMVRPVPMADGRIDLVLSATDNSGKVTTTPPIGYFVDNTPPVVEIQVPKPAYYSQDGEIYIELNNLPSLVRGSEIIGVMSDDQGLRAGFPVMKFWRNDDGKVPPPENYKDNAGWADVQNYDTIQDWPGKAEGWIPADQGFISSVLDKPIARQFRLSTRKHDVNGKPLTDPVNDDQDRTYQLPVGRYSIMVRAADLSKPDESNPNGLETWFPAGDPAGTKRIDFLLDENANPPVVEVSTDKASEFIREDFHIRAEAVYREPDTEIISVELRVEGRYKNKTGNGWVLLKKVAKSIDFTYDRLDFSVEFGKSYNNLEELKQTVANADASHPDYVEVTFTDSPYTFQVYATSDGGSYTRKNLNVYLDRVLPAANINTITRYYKQEDITGTPGYRKYTVNGTIAVEVNTSDNQGNSREPNGMSKFKYILSPTVLDIPDTPAGAVPGSAEAAAKQSRGAELWNHGGATYFDDSSHPHDVKVEGGDGEYAMKIRTQNYNAGSQYDLWFYIIAKDNAGNYNYARSLLYVDQNTDIPEIEIGSIRTDGSDLFNETMIIRISAKDDDGFPGKNALRFRYNKDAGTDQTAVISDNDSNWSPWYTIPMGSPTGAPGEPGTTFVIAPDGFSVSEFQMPMSALFYFLTGGTLNFTAVYNTNKPLLWQHLGPESTFKAVQFEISDDENKKLELVPGGGRDGVQKKTAAGKFTIDLTAPQIDTDQPSPLTAEQPFILPRKEAAYFEPFVAEGWLKETYFRYFRVIVDSKIAIESANINKRAEPQYSDVPGNLPPSNYAGVYKNTARGTVWNKVDLKWRFPMTTPVPTSSGGIQPLWDQLNDGAHNFRIDMIDWAGNTLTEQITFYKDGSPPAIKFGNINKISGGGAGLDGTYPHLNDTNWAKLGSPAQSEIPAAIMTAINSSRIGDADARLQGTFVDSYSAVKKTFWYRLEKNNYPNVSTTWPSSGTAAGKAGWLPVEISDDEDISLNWVIPIPAAAQGGGDGYYRVSILVQDKYGNGYGEKAGSWAGPPAAEGFGPGYELNAAFNVDSTGPALAFAAGNTPPDTVKGPFGFKITAADASGINAGTVKAWIQADSSPTPLNTIKGTFESGNTYGFTNMAVTGLTAGTRYTLFVQAEDNVGHSTTITNVFAFDNAPPSGEIILPIVNEANGTGKFIPSRVTAAPVSTGSSYSSTIIQGSASDNVAVAKIEFQLGKDEVSANTWTDTRLNETDSSKFHDNWKTSTGLYSWKYTLPAFDMAAAASRAKAKRIRLNLSYYAPGYSGTGYTMNGLDAISESTDTADNWWLLPFNVRITDTAGNAAIVKYYIIVDPDMDIPTITIAYPTEGLTVGGEVRVNGHAEDNDFIYQVQYRIGNTKNANPANDADWGTWKAATLTSAGPVVNWYFNINSDGSLNPSTGENRETRVEVAAWDSTDFGNSGGVWSYEKGKRYLLNLIFDASVPVVDEIKIDRRNGSAIKDWPVVTAGTMASRTFVVSANIHDETGISRIAWNDGTGVTNLYKTGDSAVAIPSTVTSLISGQKYIIASVGNTDFTALGAASNERGVTFTSSGTAALTGGATAVPMNGTNPASNAYVLGPEFDTAFTVTKEKLIPGNWYKITEVGSGTDWAGLGVTGTPIAGTSLFKPTASQIAAFTNGGGGKALDITYKVIVEVNSLHNYTDAVGSYSLILQAEDTTTKPAQTTINIQIDNQYPVAEYTGIGPTIMGNYYFRGTARDNGSIETLDKVVVWFSKSGTNVPLYEGINSSHPKYAALTAKYGSETVLKTFTPRSLQVKDSADGTLKTIPIPANTVSGITIDHNEVFESKVPIDSDGDDFVESWTAAGASQSWYTVFDSETLTGGFVELNFLVFDKAGNATYYKKTHYTGSDDANKFFIKNHGPRILRVDLVTSLYTNGALHTESVPITKGVVGSVQGVDGLEPPWRLITDANFSVRNNYLKFTLDVANGNNKNHYRVSYMTADAAEVTALTAGKVYQISKAGTGNPIGSTRWTALGAPSDNPAVGTVFVAAYNAAGLANGWKVRGYSMKGMADTPSAVVKKGDLTGGSAGNTAIVEFDTFGTDIPDTAMNNGAVFHIKVWDSVTEPGGNGPEADQIADEVYLGLTVSNGENVKPVAMLYDLNPMPKNYTGRKALGNLMEADALWSGKNFAPDAIDVRNPDTNMTGDVGLEANRQKAGFYYIANTEGGLDKSGHIEPRRSGPALTNSFFDILGETAGIPTGDASFINDAVSGKVILRGYVTDNQRIESVTLVFDTNGDTAGGEAPVKILESDASRGGRLKIAAGQPADTVFFKDVLDLTRKDNHRVEWAYIWDTETIPSGTVTGTVQVTVTVEDGKANKSDQTALTAAANGAYNKAGFDIKPYITSIKRDDAFDTLRSRQGWYSLRRSRGTDNEKVSVHGFNLYKGGASISFGNASAITSGFTSASVSLLVFNLPQDAMPGEIVLKVPASGTEAVNSLARNMYIWNKENSASEQGSDLWTDTRYAHIWDIHNMYTGTPSDPAQNTTRNNGYFDGSESPVHPALTVDPRYGVLYASWSDFQDGTVFMGRNNTATGKYQLTTSTTATGWIYRSMDPAEYTDIAWGRGRIKNSDTPAIAYLAAMSTNTAGASSWGTVNSGGTFVWDPNTNGSGVLHTDANAYLAESNSHNKMLKQFINQRIVTYNNNMHVSYYDIDTKSLHYWYNYSGVTRSIVEYNGNIAWTPSTPPGSMRPKRWINLDGGSDSDDTTGTDRVRSGTRSNSAGEFSAIDVTSEGYPVIAYYDAATQNIKIANANAEIPLSAANWSVQAVTESLKYSGKYISMRIDRGTTDRIHLAFNRTSNGTLVYMTGTRTGSVWTFTGPGNGRVEVDNVGSVGKWSDISLDSSGNPYISYLDSSNVDTFSGLKMAYCTNFASGADRFTSSKWETINVPAISTISDARTSIENFPVRGVTSAGNSTQPWSAAIGYASDCYRIAYFIKP
jgi:hypothetical protein